MMSALEDVVINYEDEPEWCDPRTGMLASFDHLWYRGTRVRDTILDLYEGEIDTSSSLARRMSAWKTGEQQWVSVASLDRMFCELRLPSFHTVLGPPEMYRKRPAPPPKNGGNAKLTMDQRFEIRRRKAAGESAKSLADEFGVVVRTIRRV